MTSRNILPRLLCGAAMAGLFTGASGLAQAQTAKAPDAGGKPVATAAVDEVVVTGSRIRGVAPIGSTVIGLDNTAISKTTTSSVSDLLRRVPQVVGFGFDESNKSAQGPGVSGTNASRASSVNLRGLGPGATLVMFDGQRMSQGGIAGGVQDPSGIPAAALQRVEVVADGASAIYGSDAVAGVVNFIPKTRFDGFETLVRLSMANGQERHQYSQTLGHDWGSGSLLVVLEHYDQTSINGTERRWFESDLRSRGGTDYRTDQCNPGTIVIGANTYAIPANGVTAATAATLTAGTRNFCDTFKLGDIVPKQTRNSGYVSVQQDINPDVRLTFRGFYSRREFNVRDITQGSTSLLATGLQVPTTNAFFVAPPGATLANCAASVGVPAGTKCESVNYNFIQDMGLLKVDGFSENYQAIAGVEMRLPYEWRADLHAVYSRDNDQIYTIGPVAANLTAALNSSDPATAFDPFGLRRTSPATLAKVFSQVFKPYARSINSTGQGNASGPLFKLPGGQVRLAVGVDYTVFNVGAGSVRGPIAGPTLAFLYTPRTVRSAYAELFVPLVGAANSLPGVRRLDLSLAGRYDDYDDVGQTKNPKIGVNYEPLDGLLLKASYGTSFKAPSVTNNRSPRAGAALIVGSALDPKVGATVTGVSINDGNPNLTPERAKTYSFTAEYKPVQIPGLMLSVTRFSVDYKDQISTIPGVAAALANPIYASLVTRNPTAAQLAATGLPVQGILPANVAYLVDARPSNLGGTAVSGYDFTGGYDWRTDLGAFSVGVGGTYMDKYEVKITATAPAVSQLNNFNYPNRFRARGYADWSQGPWSAGLVVNYIGKYDYNLSTPVQKVNSWMTLDARVTYAFDGPGILTGTQVTLSADNLLDKDPPFVNVAGGFDSSSASAIGRLVSVTVDKKW